MTGKRPLFDKISAPRTIRIDPSRCLRMRFHKSTCRKCLDACPANALQIRETIRIDSQTCSECMVCTAACPAEALTIRDADFFSKISKIKKNPFPAMQCLHQPDFPEEESFPCLGFLAEEHILAMAAVLERPLQMNWAACAACRNGFIVPILKNTLRNVDSKTSLRPVEKIKPREDGGKTKIEKISHERRTFLTNLKKLNFLGIKKYGEHLGPEKDDPAYADKVLPAKRTLLNRSFSLLPKSIQEEVRRHYFYHLILKEGCNLCQACIAMCPTGALEWNKKESDGRLLFRSSLCTGCGLCKDFCPQNSIRIQAGFPGEDPFVARIL